MSRRLVYLGLVLLFGLALAGMHEEVHKQIYEYGGCTNVEIHYFALFDENPGFMSTSGNCAQSPFQKEVLLAHMINEIVGYLFIPITVFVSYILLLNLEK